VCEDTGWRCRTTGLMAIAVTRVADLAASRLKAVKRVLRRRIREVRGEVQHLRAAEQAVARAFAGLRGDGAPKAQRRRMKRSIGRDIL
jgi:hypothetical protein